MKLMETLWLFSMVDHSSSMGMISFCFLSLSFQMFYNKPTRWPASSWLISSVGRVLQWAVSQKSRVRILSKPEFFFTTTYFSSTTAMIVFHLMVFFFSLSLFYNSGYHFVLLFSLEFEHIARYHHLLLIHGTSCRQCLATTATPSQVR